MFPLALILVFFYATVNAAPISEIQVLMNIYYPDNKEDISRLSETTDETLNEAIQQIDPWASWRIFKPAALNKLAQASIGADLLQRNNQWWLIPYRGGSLDKKGIINRVQLLKINQHKVNKMTAEQVSESLRGIVNSFVCITIFKKTAFNKEQQLCLIRKKISFPSVEEIDTAKGIVIRIRTFRLHETRFLLQQLLLKVAQRQDKFYIDLRESPGGDLYEALDCAALFLPKETVLAKLVDKKESSWEAKAPSTFPTFSQPIKIMVGSDTASAAEIFAGILQYQKRAKIIGQTTRGKCLSQTDFFLSDGSILHLTNMEIYYPNGDTCHTQGVIPDILF